MDWPGQQNENCTVSPYWTPQHVDVTHAPLRYASPKGTWIEEFQRLKGVLASNTADRIARQRMHTHAIVDPCEITALPVINALARERTARPPLLARVRAILRYA
jgi:hypothetical protein